MDDYKKMMAEKHSQYVKEKPASDPKEDVNWVSGKAMEKLFGPTLVNLNKEKKLTSSVLGGKIVGIYFSASWCGPCRQFSPTLVKFHEELKKKNKDFEVVLVSSDQTEDKMYEYMAHDQMKWYALPFGAAEIGILKTKYNVRGIPSLVIINPEGKTITENGRAEVQQGTGSFDQWK